MVMPRLRKVASHNHSNFVVVVSGEDSRVVEGAIGDRVQLRKESDVDIFGLIEVLAPLVIHSV